nr:DUF6544 family protein [Bacillus dakarensis]
MKLKPNQKTWYTAEVEQYVTTNQPGFLWKVKMKMSPFMHVVGRDKFQDGKAAMTMKMGSLLSVVNTADHEKINQSSLSRYLMEIIWVPSTALSPYITWKEIDQNSAEATMTYKGVSVSAVFYFDDSGDFLKVSA